MSILFLINNMVYKFEIMLKTLFNMKKVILLKKNVISFKKRSYFIKFFKFNLHLKINQTSYRRTL